MVKKELICQQPLPSYFYSGLGKLDLVGRNLKASESKEIKAFWKFVRETAKEVRTWPEWKLGSIDRPPSGIKLNGQK